MSWEDWLMKMEGMTDQQVADLHARLEELEKTIGTVKTVIQLVKGEIPRIERIVATFESTLATVNAAQRRFNHG